MKKQTKPYITLRDRDWKGKDWFTSYRSYKNIRRLTDEEAKPFLEDGTIEEVKLKKEPTIGVVGNKNGTMVCLKCGSQRGFFVYKMHRGKQSGWYNLYTCADCGEREKMFLY